MRLCGLLCVVLFLTGCSAERSDGPKDTAQLVQRLKSAIEDADVKELGVLYETPPVRLDDGADLFKEMCQFWAENEYKIYETELYPSLNAEGIPIKFDAEGYIFIVAQDGPPGKIGTTTLTSDFYCKQINGNVYLLNPATTSEIAVNEQTSIRFLLVPKGSTEEVLKQLGSKSDTTFENAWDGITFTSYSMGDLADFISSEVGFRLRTIRGSRVITASPSG